MAKTISDISKLIKPYIIKAMTLMRDEISDTIQYHIDKYYEEEFFKKNNPKNKPYQYNRTYRFKNELSKSVYPVEYVDGVFSFKVGFGEDYLTFKYKQETGLQVLEWANDRSHGGIYGGNGSQSMYGKGKVEFWNDAMEEIVTEHGSIQNMFKKKCIQAGLPIK